MKPFALIQTTFIQISCAKTARFLPAKLVENCGQQSNLYTTHFSNRVDEKSFQILGTNAQQLIHRVIRSKYPVFAGQADVNNIFSQP
jgi:hypothetical protein